MDIAVIKKDGRKEQFFREKLKQSITKACGKRLSDEKVEEMVDDIEHRLRSFESNEIPSKKIGEEVMRALKKADKISYIRFAAIYREFADVEELEDEIKKLVKKNGDR